MIELLIPLLISLRDTNLESEAQAAAHIEAAQLAATPAVPLDLLLAIAYIETHHAADSVSVLINGRRSIGRRSTARPRGRLASIHCGATQATAKTWAECVALRDLGKSYAATVVSLERWLGHTRGNLGRALAGYGCGWKASLSGVCRGYPGRVTRVQRMIARRIAGSV